MVLAADTLWIGVFVALLGLQGATRSAFLSAAFFIALFTACSMFYGRLAYTVSDSGLTVRTFSAVRHFSFEDTFSAVRHFSFEDILRVDVLPTLLGTSYAVRTRLGPLQFSSLLGGHERLCHLIVRRAGLV